MKINILGTNIDSVSKEQALALLIHYMSFDATSTVYTPNAEICMEAYKNKKFQNVLNRGSLVIPDGQGVVLASKILKTPVKEKVAGFKLTLSLFESDTSFSCYLLGAKPGVTDKVKNIIENKYPNVHIAGHRNGYFNDCDIPSIIENINALNVDLVLVALGPPNQEFFIDSYKEQLNCKVMMGVGGSFDVIAGEVKRTPEIFVKLSLEWFHRLITQPKRFKRMLKIPVFLLICLKKRITH